MERRDYLMAQIEEMGRALARLVSGFLGLKKNGDPARGLVITNEQFKSEVDIDIDYILEANQDEVKKYLSERKLVDSHMEILSDYFKEVGISLDDRDEAGAREWYEKAMHLLEIADETSNTASFMRISKKEELEMLIKRNR